MTKTYEGNGEHTIHLDSGRVLNLHEDELIELSGSHVSVELYEVQCNAVRDAKSILEDLHSASKELDPGETERAIKALIFEMDEVLINAKRQFRNF